jgi:adenylate cyclase
MSEYTYNAGGNQFVTRKLDRVRVVGIKQPVRLYELIDEPDAISDEEMDRVNKYHEVLELFEKKRWEDARDGFEELKDENLEDGTILSYIRRCNEKIKEKSKKKKDDDDGIVELREKK